MQNYSIIKVLNSGSFGTAILVRKKSDGALHVIKDIDMSKLSKKERETTVQEVKILEALRHPNIVAFEEAFTQDGSLKIVMQYCDGGDLLGLVKSRTGQLLDENYVLDIFVQLSLAIKHVHDRKIIHRDIKTENIFLSSHKRVVKLGDFGIAKVLENTLQQARTAIGTPYYLSPEICQGKLYNFKSDIWSLGVVLYELCALRCPFAGANMKGLMLCISKGSYSPIPASFSSEMRKLIADMLNLNPKSRPSINDLLRRPILQQRIAKLIEGNVLRQEFSHTTLHGQHYSQSKCPNPAASPAQAEAAEPLPSHALEGDRPRAGALQHVGRVADNQVECSKAQVKAVSDAKGAAAISKPQVCQPTALQRDKLLGDVISEKLERERRDKELARILSEKRENEAKLERERRDKAAIMAEKAERERRDKELARILSEKRENEAKLERERRDRELARQKELHLQRQADAAVAAACCLDRAQEDRAKEKVQQALALEAFRQKQAKHWLGGVVQPAPSTPAPAEPCMVRKDIAAPALAVMQDRDVAVAKRLWSPKAPALNAVDQVKARGAAQKIEEQQRYEQALAIARKQAYLERLAAENRRQREMLCALEDKRSMAEQAPAVVASCHSDAVLHSDVPSADKLPQLAPPAPHPSSTEACSVANILPRAALASEPAGESPVSEVASAIGSANRDANAFEIVLDDSEAHSAEMCEADNQEEQSLREIVGELMHLTLDPPGNGPDDCDGDIETSSVFEKIEGLRMQLESHLGTENFLDLYELARACQDGSSGKLEAQIDSLCSNDSDVVFNSLVQLLNFESEVYNS